MSSFNGVTELKEVQYGKRKFYDDIDQENVRQILFFPGNIGNAPYVEIIYNDNDIAKLIFDIDEVTRVV